MFRPVPHRLNDAELGVLIVLLVVAGGLMWLYNAWRLGKLPWKPKGPPNAKMVCAVIVLIFVLAMVLPFVIH